MLVIPNVGDLVMSGRIRVGVTTVTGGGPLSSAQVAISHLQAGLVVPRCPQHRDRSRWVKTGPGKTDRKTHIYIDIDIYRYRYRL